jgi:polar amino acid transport system substrate-binding protein
MKVLCVFLLGLLVPLAQAQDKLVTWATNPAYPPYDWVNAQGAYDGAAAEVLELVLPAGYKLEPSMVPWKRAQELAKSGKVDLLVNFRKTPERETWLQFSVNPTFSNPVAIFVREDRRISFANWDQLKGLKGGVSLGDTFGNGFDEYLAKNLTVEVAPSVNENFKKLDAGRIDWFVSGVYMGLAWLSQASLHPIVALTPYVSNDSIYLGMSKLSPHLDLLADIDRKLAALKADGTLDRLLARNLKKFYASPAGAFP